VPSAPPDIQFLEIEEVRLRTSVRGEGRPLLLITGLGASLDLAVPFERQLCARGRQVISFDAPGVGRSTPYRWPRRLPGLVRTIGGLLDRLGLEQVDVLGVSLGGAVAQQLARSAPERVRRLVLAATTPGVGGVPGSPQALMHLATPRRYRDPAHYAQIAGQIYGGAARTDPAGMVRAVLGPAKPPSTVGYLGQLYAISGWSSLPWLHTVRHPTLVLAGDDDPIVPVLNGHLMAWRLPDARLHVVRGGGHLFILERPAEIAEVVTTFLDAADAPERRSAAGGSRTSGDDTPRGG
jgi:poly(3-hydroxyalkanoate) depolymerase